MNAAALGEYDHGARKGNDSMLMMTIGTGTGGTVVIQGDVYHGYSRSAIRLVGNFHQLMKFRNRHTAWAFRCDSGCG